MTLQSYTLTIGALIDENNSGKNYVSDQPIYIKTKAGVLAPIFRDIDGTSEIFQDGLSNKTDSRGQFVFFVEQGDYIAEYQSQQTPISVFGADYFNSRIDESVAQITADTALSRGYNRKGTFVSGFTYELANDVGIDADGNAWVYTDIDALPVVVISGTVPSDPAYKPVVLSDHNSLINRSAVGAHDDIYKRTITLNQAISEDLTVGTEIVIKDRGYANAIVVSSGTKTIDSARYIGMNNGNIIEVLSDENINLVNYGLQEGADLELQTAAQDAAFRVAQEKGGGCELIFPKGNLLYNGVWRPILSSVNDIKIKGYGSGDGGTEIKFEYVAGGTTSIEFDKAFFGLTLVGIHFRGQGQTALNNGSKQRGMTDLNAPAASYGVRIEDIQISDFSADAARIARWFQQSWRGCYAKRIGQDGYVLSGDQNISWIGSGGSFFSDIGIEGDNSIRRFCLWIKSGKPVIHRANFGPVNNMIKLGEGPLSPCRATLKWINMEWIKQGGIGIYVTANSQILDSEDLLAWGPYDTNTTAPNTEEAKAIVWFEKLLGKNVLNGVKPSFVPSNDSFGGFENMIYIEAADSATNPYLLLDRSKNDEFTFRGATINYVQGPTQATQYATGVKANNFLDSKVISKGIDCDGPIRLNPLVWVRSVDGSNIDLDPTTGSLPDKSTYLLKPDDGQITVKLPPSNNVNVTGNPITFANITSAESFRLNTFGTTTINGSNGVTFSAAYESVTIIPDGSGNWVILSGNS